MLGFAVFMGLTSPVAWETTHPSRDLPDTGAPLFANAASCQSGLLKGYFMTNQWIANIGASTRTTSPDDDDCGPWPAHLPNRAKDVGAAPAVAKTVAATP